MVAPLLSLRWQVYLSTLRRSVWQMIGFAFAALYAVGFGILAIVGLLFLGLRGDVSDDVVALGSLLVVVWTVGPLVAFGVDDTFDPRRLAQFPPAGTSSTEGEADSGTCSSISGAAMTPDTVSGVIGLQLRMTHHASSAETEALMVAQSSAFDPRRRLLSSALVAAATAPKAKIAPPTARAMWSGTDTMARVAPASSTTNSSASPMPERNHLSVTCM